MYPQHFAVPSELSPGQSTHALQCCCKAEGHWPAPLPADAASATHSHCTKQHHTKPEKILDKRSLHHAVPQKARSFWSKDLCTMQYLTKPDCFGQKISILCNTSQTQRIFWTKYLCTMQCLTKPDCFGQKISIPCNPSQSQTTLDRRFLNHAIPHKFRHSGQGPRLDGRDWIPV